MADVAARAGVSRGAVSFVLTGRNERIPEATKARVRRAAEELGYRPNLTARGLRTGQSGAIALLSDAISTTAFGGASIRGALDVARSRSRMLYTAETLGDPDVERELVEGLLDRRVDGFLYAFMSTSAVNLPRRLAQTPTVVLNGVPGDADITSVIPDDRAAGAAAVARLFEAGHHDDIILLGDVPSKLARPLPLFTRLNGIQEALGLAGEKLAGSLLVEAWEPPSGREAIFEYLSSNSLPGAIIALNDRLAFGAYQAVTHHGARVGQDVSLVSFDGSDLAAWLDPPLESFQLPYRAMGELAMNMLLDGETAAGRQIVPMPLVSGESVRRA